MSIIDFMVKPSGVVTVPEHGATLSWYDPEPGLRILARIEVLAPFRGRGYGSAILGPFTELADREGVTVILGVAPDGGLDETVLRAWYGRNGFETVRDFQTPAGRDLSNPDDDTIMVRRPRGRADA